jgi:arylsulfatase A-like enzyme
MRSFIRLRHFIAALPMLSSPSIGTPVSLVNPSFESERNPAADGAFSQGSLVPSGWSVIATDNTSAVASQVAVGFKDIVPADPAAGTLPTPQALNLKAGAAIGQITALPWAGLQVGAVLTLTVAVGDRSASPPIWPDESFFGFSEDLAGSGGIPSAAPGSATSLNPNWITGIVARTPALTAPPTGIDSGTMGDVTLTHTVVAADLLRPGNVGIFIASIGQADSTALGTASSAASQAFFDHVRLDSTAAVNPPVATGPNIIFYFMDDMRWDVAGFTGNKIITTPNIDSLASQGMIFENAFTTTPICMSSRACVFMGQHMARHKITTFGGTLSAAKWANSYPARLDAAGYYLGFIGKHGLGDFVEQAATYDFNRSYEGQGKYINQTIKGEDDGGRHLNVFEGDLVVGNHSAPFNTTGFLEKWAALPGTKPPFCLQVSWKSSHAIDGNIEDPYPEDPVYSPLYESSMIPHARTDTQGQFDALPAFMKTDQNYLRWTYRFDTEAKFQKNVKDHHRLIHGVDVEIGRIRQRLEELGIADNTIIIFGSDHGVFLGERHFADKWTIHEESARVPLIIYDPRLPTAKRGVRASQMALNLDIPATILDYAGLPSPVDMQGRSLRPIIEGPPPADWRTEYLHDQPPSVYPSRGVRTENFVYTRYTADGNYEQLYDVTLDPWQRTNLASDPRYTSIKTALSAKTDLLYTQAQ